MDMLNQTVTVFHRREDGDRDIWSPFLIERAAQMVSVQSINTGSQREQDAPEATLRVKAGLWPHVIAPGDYVVQGACEVGEFYGSPVKALEPYGGKKIQKITGYLFGSPIDHYEVIVR